MRSKSVRLITAFAAILFFYFIIQACGKSSDQPARRRTNNVTVVNNVKYGANKNWKDKTENLLLDVYIPPVSNVQKFPLIVYIHGGGFLDGDKLDKKSLMIDFANSGYVGASINYRLGWTQGNNCNGDTTEAKEAIYRAVQDAKAAIRFLVANADKYNIDTSNIFLGGESAGAITALSTNYFTQSYANDFLPGVENKLGGLDNADNNITVSYSIKAIASIAGCLNTPDLINAANVKPTIYMHGMLDNVIPYDSGHNYNCRNFSLCYGDYYLYNITKNLAPSVMHLDSTGTHNVYDEAFIKANEVCFFNGVMQGSANAGFFTNAASSCR
jgi:predicted esterase